MSKSPFLIYNASAGAGKTYTLVKEYLKLLLNPKVSDDNYKYILSITFTNKAVNEMKQRVMNTLRAFSQDIIAEKYQNILADVCKELNIGEHYVKNKSKNIVKSIIYNYASFDISTIDKFTHRLIRSFANDLDLNVNFEVTLDTDSLIKEAVESIVAKAGKDEKLTDLIVNFSKEKTDDNKSWDVTEDLILAAKMLSVEQEKKEVDKLSRASLDNFIQCKNAIHSRIEDIDKGIIELTEKFESIMQHNGIDYSNLNRFVEGNIQKLRENQSISTHYNSIDKIITKKTYPEEFHYELIEVLTELYNLHYKKMFLLEVKKNLVPVSLLNSIYKEMKSIEEERNMLSIAEFNGIIHNEIKNQPAPFIYEKLGDRYHHFFIDEFQDTSVLQWENLIPLIDNAVSAEKNGISGSLMLVGDPKQSIYRWRGGKAEQFMELSNDMNPFPHIQKEVRNLETNYRSYSNIIEFNNAFFQTISGTFDNEVYQTLYKEKSSQKINSKLGGYVEIQLLPQINDDMEEENPEEDGNINLPAGTKQYLDATLQKIRSAISQGFGYSDIAVLVRKRKEGVLVANMLTENGIAVISSEALLIDNSNEVKFIISVLLFVDNTEHQKAKVDMLYYLGKHRVGEEDIHQFIIDGKNIDDEKLFEAWLQSKGFEISFEFIRTNSLYSSVEYIVDVFFKEYKTISYVQYFLDTVLEQTMNKQLSISDFISYWEEKKENLSIPAPVNTNAVQIMTIHKAKGLEFPVVIFPFADWEIFSTKNKVWVQTNEFNEYNIPVANINLKKDIVNFGQNTEAIYYSKQQEELLDVINVLYVALTRAGEQLYIISRCNVNKGMELRNKLSRFFIQYLVQIGELTEQDILIGKTYSIGQARRLSEPEYNPEERSTLFIECADDTLTQNMIKIAQREAMIWGTGVGEAVTFGNLIHLLMAKIKTADDIVETIDDALVQGLIEVEAKDKIMEMMKNIVEHKDLQDFFKPNVRVYNEWALLQKGNSTHKPDRVVIDGNMASILDYKTGEHNNKYVQQVKNYARIIEEMGYRIKRTTLVYIGENIECIDV